MVLLLGWLKPSTVFRIVMVAVVLDLAVLSVDRLHRQRLLRVFSELHKALFSGSFASFFPSSSPSSSSDAVDSVQEYLDQLERALDVYHTQYQKVGVLVAKLRGYVKTSDASLPSLAEDMARIDQKAVVHGRLFQEAVHVVAALRGHVRMARLHGERESSRYSWVKSPAFRHFLARNVAGLLDFAKGWEVHECLLQAHIQTIEDLQVASTNESTAPESMEELAVVVGKVRRILS